MALRTALLTSRNINLDTDFSKYIESVSDAGVITGFAVTASSVATGQARVPCTRTNLETIYAFVQNFNSISISGDGYVIISIPQEIVDNGGGNEDGTGIATVEVVDTLPTKNYLLLATISGGTVTDNRVIIPKVGELKTDVDTIFAQIADLDERVDALEAAGAIDHLEERALVGENYTLSNTLFRQVTPALADCTVDANVGDVAANTEIHIQRLGSGTASSTLKLKMKKVGSPTTSVKVEIKAGTKVTVSSSEAYWYGSGDTIATGTLASSSFSSDFGEVTFSLDNEFGGTEGQLLDIIVYQTTGSDKVVNASNYYVLACDSTQWSEGFSYVSVNGSTRTRSKLMPYCISTGFAQYMLAKVKGDYNYYNYIVNYSGSHYFVYGQTDILYENTETEARNIEIYLKASNKYHQLTFGVYASKGGTTKYSLGTYEASGYTTSGQYTTAVGDFIQLNAYGSTASTGYDNVNYYIREKFTITQTITTHKSKPRELKAIGEKATGTLFGYHIDNTRYNGE